MRGRIVKLDRGFPLVRTEEGALVRCEHATELVKGKNVRAAIGDIVELALPEGHDKGIIENIENRRTAFVRRDPAERTTSQVLAANFDLVIVAEPVSQLNLKRLERELVLAHQTGADVAIVLTKSDLASEGEVHVALDAASDLAGRSVDVLPIAANDAESIEQVRALVKPGTLTVLVGKSGVGKSSLVNLLVGREVQQTGAVREHDGKGRHTTVSREVVDIPGGGSVVDMPGIRGLGLWDADAGIEAAFADIAELAASCRFRDCRHIDEPGCAVRQAVAEGELGQTRLDSYLALRAEAEQTAERREQARQMRGEKASDMRQSSGKGSSRKLRPYAKRGRR